MKARGRGRPHKWHPTTLDHDLIAQINTMKNETLAKRLSQLNLLRMASREVGLRKPLKGFGNMKRRYIPLRDDYHDVIKCLNAANQAGALQTEVLIPIASHLDRLIYAYEPPLLEALDGIEPI